MEFWIGNKRIKKPNTQLWYRLMLLHLPVLHDYALRKLEKWYFEDEPLLFEQQRLDAISRARAGAAERPKF